MKEMLYPSEKAPTLIRCRLCKDIIEVNKAGERYIITISQVE
jgi:hypothetical protein